MNSDIIEFHHPELNETTSAIGGDYLLNEEVRAEMEEGEVLYYTGYFMIDRSCCGVAGSAYGLVPGFVVDWHFRTDENGRPVSRVRRITSPRVRKRVEDRVRSGDPLRRVTFL